MEEDLEKQMVKGQLNIHSTLSRMSEKINELEAFVFGINDALIEKNMLQSRYLFKKIESVKKEMMDSGEKMHAGIALRVDNEQVGNAEVNCSERIHVCKAICCKLSFPLSAIEVEKGIVKWDLGRPYYVRQTGSGFCCHKGESGNCSVYENRPVVCKTYSCKGDERIWKDFENMIINKEWINENLDEGFPEEE